MSQRYIEFMEGVLNSEILFEAQKRGLWNAEEALKILEANDCPDIILAAIRQWTKLPLATSEKLEQWNAWAAEVSEKVKA